MYFLWKINTKIDSTKRKYDCILIRRIKNKVNLND